MTDNSRVKSNKLTKLVLELEVNIHTSVTHIRTDLFPERAEKTRSETVVGSIRHQVCQTLEETIK